MATQKYLGPFGEKSKVHEHIHFKVIALQNICLHVAKN